MRINSIAVKNISRQSFGVSDYGLSRYERDLLVNTLLASRDAKENTKQIIEQNNVLKNQNNIIIQQNLLLMKALMIISEANGNMSPYYKRELRECSEQIKSLSILG